MSPTRVELSEEVAFRELSGEGVLLDLASGTYFGLNAVGARLWSLLAEDGSLDHATAVLEREFEVSGDVLRTDLRQLLGDMQAKGLVQLVESNA